MTPQEVAVKLHLKPEPRDALLRLCARGCDPRVLGDLLVRLTSKPVLGAPARRPRRGRRRPYRMRPELEVTGGFAPVPSQEPDPPQGEFILATTTVRNFKTREVIAVGRQLRNAAAQVSELLQGSLARRVMGDSASPVLTVTLPDRLLAYADTVIPRFLEGGQRRTWSTKRSTARPTIVNHRPLDELKTALGTFRVRDVKPLERRLTKLAHRIRVLHASRYGRVVEEEYPVFLALPDGIEQFASSVVARMGERAVGPKERPDTTRLLWRLFDYVKEQSGRFHDAELAAILDGARFHLGRQAEVNDETALRNWRSQHPRPAPTEK